MGFGGVGSMNVVLKNNKRLLPQREKFKSFWGGYSSDKLEFDLPVSTPLKLREIKMRMQKEHKQRQTKIIVAFSLLLVIITTCLIYLSNDYDKIISML